MKYFRVPLDDVNDRDFIRERTENVPCPLCFLENSGNQWQNRQKEDRFRDMKEVEDGRTLLVQPYPTRPTRLLFQLVRDSYV